MCRLLPRSASSFATAGLELDALCVLDQRTTQRPLSAEPPYTLWNPFAICVLIYLSPFPSPHVSPWVLNIIRKFILQHREPLIRSSFSTVLFISVGRNMKTGIIQPLANFRCMTLTRRTTRPEQRSLSPATSIPPISTLKALKTIQKVAGSVKRPEDVYPLPTLACTNSCLQPETKVLCISLTWVHESGLAGPKVCIPRIHTHLHQGNASVVPVTAVFMRLMMAFPAFAPFFCCPLRERGKGVMPLLFLDNKYR